MIHLWEFRFDLSKFLIGLFLLVFDVSFLNWTRHLSYVGLAKFFSHPAGCRFVLLIMSFVLQMIFRFMGHQYIYYLSINYPLIISLFISYQSLFLCQGYIVPESCLLCQWVQVYSWPFCLSGSRYLDLCWGNWTTRNWVLYIMIDIDLFEFFDVLTYS